MIYIFDDRFERRKIHSPQFIKNRDQITFSEFTPEGDLDKYIADFFGDAEIIILHYSYRFHNDNLTLEDILKAFRNIPVILFSGGFKNASVQEPDKRYRVNSIVMYDNLPVFLKQRQKDKYTPIEILLFGKKFVINQFMKLLYELNQSYFDKTNLKIDSDEIIDLIEDILSYSGLENERHHLIHIVERNKETLTYPELVKLIENIMHEL